MFSPLAASVLKPDNRAEMDVKALTLSKGVCGGSVFDTKHVDTRVGRLLIPDVWRNAPSVDDCGAGGELRGAAAHRRLGGAGAARHVTLRSQLGPRLII